mmetsp:Transcript_24501/g.28851  ORF Transcript_24501/g.28851 Transcript_24501/m.28851 type:complete len:126 (+) Transcript_24501:25-402(+)
MSCSSASESESRYNNIINGTPFNGDNGVSFLAFCEMTETGLGILLRNANIPFGKQGDLLALKAQLSQAAQEAQADIGLFGDTDYVLPSFLDVWSWICSYFKTRKSQNPKQRPILKESSLLLSPTS